MSNAFNIHSKFIQFLALIEQTALAWLEYGLKENLKLIVLNKETFDINCKEKMNNCMKGVRGQDVFFQGRC